MPNFRRISARAASCTNWRATGKTIVFYCAFGERSAMAVQAAQDAGLASARHIEGGMAPGRKQAARRINLV